VQGEALASAPSPLSPMAGLGRPKDSRILVYFEKNSLVFLCKKYAFDFFLPFKKFY
jgi:hypothetical protein